MSESLTFKMLTGKLETVRVEPGDARDDLLDTLRESDQFRAKVSSGVLQLTLATGWAAVSWQVIPCNIAGIAAMMVIQKRCTELSVPKPLQMDHPWIIRRGHVPEERADELQEVEEIVLGLAFSWIKRGCPERIA